MKTLIIDNHDSFSYNLYQMIAEINGVLPILIQNDSHCFDDLAALDYDNIVISPGPGHPAIPNDFGICARVLQESTVPILGICLGHQGIAHVFGGHVIQAPEPMHGRISRIRHEGDALFAHIPESFQVVRYHSLMINPETLPACLQVTARTEDGVIMGIRHRTRPLWGIQFHPESICTEYGKPLLQNFKNLTTRYHALHPKRAPSPKTTIRTPHPTPIPVTPDETTTTSTVYALSIKKRTVWSDPQAVFQRLYRHQKKTVWLDSSHITPGLSRFSYMGTLDGPLSYSIAYDVTTKTITRSQGTNTTHIHESVFDFLKQELKHYATPPQDVPFPFHGGFIGYFGYELHAETVPKHSPSPYLSPYQDAQFLFLDRVMVFDHEEQTLYLLALSSQDTQNQVEPWFQAIEQVLNAPLEDASRPQNPLQNSVLSSSFRRDKNTYLQDIHRCQHAIREGNSYEICLTNTLNIACTVDPYHYYSALRHVNPAPYAAFLTFDALAIACSSVERFLLIDAHKNVETKPMKGTLARGRTEREEADRIAQLVTDEKFQSENLMIVDLLRHDLGRVCEIGSVHVPRLMHVETYETVHQLVSTIRGQLQSTQSPIDCIMAAFPGGSMTGAPKIRTMEIIQSLEKEARGIYSGALGFLSLNGAVDLNIVIRTAVITTDQLSIGVGGAIIALSDPEEEYQEMLLKTNALKTALTHAIQQ